MKGWTIVAWGALAGTMLLGPASADHLDDGSYRCDGGWCRDGRDYVLTCSPSGRCWGDTTGFPSIVDPAFGSGGWLEDDDWVLGVSVGNEHKAYPIRIISGQQGWELVEDTIGGVPIVVTYCPLCASGIVYSRVLDGEPVTLFNSGAIWRADLVMVDEGTRSQWSQVTGEALDGPMHGRQLDLIGSQMVRWAAWKEAYPSTLAMQVPRDLDNAPLCACPSISLDPALLVHGVVVNGTAIAFPVAWVAQEGVVHIDGPSGPLVAAFAGDNVHVYAAAGPFRLVDTWWLQDEDGRYYRVLDGASDDGPALEKVPGRTTFAHRWTAFYPDSILDSAAAPATNVNEEEGEEAPASVAIAWLALLGAWVITKTKRR